MTSQLNNFVPVLNSTNYQQWAAAMQSYLMSQGQWKCVKTGATIPTLKIEEGESNQGEIDSWLENEEKVLGNIRLRLHHTIGMQYNDTNKPTVLWATLLEKYGSPGLSRAFIEFKGAMDAVIPNGSDPAPALDKILTHFTTLAQMKWSIPEKVKAMILLAKAPSSMESIVQLMAQVNRDDEEKPMVADIIKAMTISWETHK